MAPWQHAYIYTHHAHMMYTSTLVFDKAKLCTKDIAEGMQYFANTTFHWPAALHWPAARHWPAACFCALLTEQR